MKYKDYWEFIIHNTSGYDDYVTAICGKCKKPLFCNPTEFMGSEKEGTVIFRSSFVLADVKEFILKNGAEIRRKDLPKYCSHCGTKMLK